MTITPPDRRYTPAEIPCIQEAQNSHADWWTSWPGSRNNLRAKRLCNKCPLQQQCAEVALEDGIPYGVWGGLDEEDRAVIWKANGGRPTVFDQIIDQETLPLLQQRRDDIANGLAS